MALLEAVGMNVRFEGIHAVRDVTVEAEQGQITGLIGPNGAGKTTTFNVITGFEPSAEGTVRLDGADISHLAPYQRARRGVARTFQRLEVFGSMTARENILTGAELSRRWSRASIRPAELADEIVDRVGLRAVADQHVDAMPTGQARLVELGRALTLRPAVLLLDEPASGLDEAETEGLAQLLVNLASDGTAILLVEHDVALVMRVCTTIYVLDHGSVLASGAPREIQQNQAVTDAYLGAAAAESALEHREEAKHPGGDQ